MAQLEIFISAGDPSGERHAARLINALRIIAGEVRVSGIGGPAMQAEGASLICPQERLAVMGLTEVLGHLRFFLDLLRQLETHLEKTRPQLIVLIDFPDFNFRLARIARRLNIPVLYYISPQVWAWRSGRKRTLTRLS
ncbi:MAG TPA: lipid-A-disaccharide synthase, partial [Candidatus Glassbacteria bacterium]|nr:lipid-A-disaccharide synthase [Candidatus Glassbacteria bacterium]